MDPLWVNKAVVLAMHERLLAEHGGASGLRDNAMLESALARPQQIHAYGDADLYALAAVYLTGIVRNHPFVDSNKRTALMTAYVFLARNDALLVASEIEAVQFVTALAAREIDENELAAWLRINCETI